MNTGEKRSREEMSDTFYKNILTLSEKLESAGKRYVLIANIPASAKNEQDTDTYWRILHMNDINDLYKLACAERGFAFISLYDRMNEYLRRTNTDLNEILKDGLHPNDKGYEIMLRLILDALGIA